MVSISQIFYGLTVILGDMNLHCWSMLTGITTVSLNYYTTTLLNRVNLGGNIILSNLVSIDIYVLACEQCPQPPAASPESLVSASRGLSTATATGRVSTPRLTPSMVWRNK